MNTTTTLIDVQVPESFPAKVRDAIATLKAANLPKLSEMIYRELRPVMDDVDNDLFERSARESGWAELFDLVTDAATALTYAVGDQVDMDGLPDYLSVEEADAIREREMERATLRVMVARGELTIPTA